MKNIDDIVIYEQGSILTAIKLIDKSSKQIGLVIDKDNKLIGTISDGDIRRALLKNISLEDSIKDIYNKSPITVNINDSRDKIINLCLRKKIYQIPVIDDNDNLVGIEILDELISQHVKPNKVILMVGGLGTRLRPLTDTIPKPMLHVGNKPILETIIENFATYGFRKIVLCVNYKSDIIENHFKDGSRYGVEIEYIYESKRMGTAGALSLLSSIPSEPFFVMNGDLLTNINFEHLLRYHLESDSLATMCVREHRYQVPFGVVEIEDEQVKSILEKPIKQWFVSAGIYMFSPEVIQNIPSNEFYDMPTLFENIMKKGESVVSFPIREYWLDIGQIEEFKQANDEYHEIF